MIETIQPKQLFAEFLQQRFPLTAETLLLHYQLFLDELFSRNQMVNLVSRQMPKADYWTYHLLDSLLVLNCMDIKSGEVLDFGTGGGLPGLPLKIAIPEIRLTLLDSVGKKIRCVEEIISALGLTGCKAVWSRLEDFAKSKLGRKFDYILCRSVKLEEAFIEPLHKLLKPDGKVIFYKAQHLEDVETLSGTQVFDVSHPAVGTRKIIIAPQRSLAVHNK